MKQYLQSPTVLVGRQQRSQQKRQKAAIVWLTGLSGAGKSTIAVGLDKKLTDEGYHSYILDGDKIRTGLSEDLDFSDNSRHENIRRIGELACLFADAGLITLVALISPFQADREKARNKAQPGEFIEVYVKASFAACQQRDPKHIYHEAKLGHIKNFTGMDSAYEEPKQAELVLDTERQSPAESIDGYIHIYKIRDFFFTRRMLPFLDDNNKDAFDLLLNSVEEAAESIMRVYNTDYDVEIKQDHSPVTIADKLSHQVLMARLPNVYDVPVLSEEGSCSWSERKNWQEFWLVDPLDGTREFIKKNGQFTINIALVRQHKAIFGLLYCPVTKQCHYAAHTLGAYKRVDNEWQRIHVHKHQDYTAVCSSMHSNKETEAFLTKLNIKHRLACGSALKFLHIAEGKAQIYPRFGPTSLWDTAAGQCIVEEAGGQVVGPDGSPLQYNDREDLLNPRFVACAEVEDRWLSIWQQS